MMIHFLVPKLYRCTRVLWVHLGLPSPPLVAASGVYLGLVAARPQTIIKITINLPDVIFLSVDRSIPTMMWKQRE